MYWTARTLGTARTPDAIDATGRTSQVTPRTTNWRIGLGDSAVWSFFLIAYEFDEPRAALMISSARHSAMVFTLRKAASLAPVQSK